MSTTEFLITLSYRDGSIRMGCAGELDISTARKLRDAIELCLEQGPARLTLDAQGISLLTSSGIEVLLDTVQGCRELGIELDLRLSKASCRILDIVGLWWLGVVDEGPPRDPFAARNAYSAARGTPEFERIIAEEKGSTR